MKTFEKHRLKFQSRQAESLGKSKLSAYSDFFLPINSCVHYLSTTQQDIGMRGNNPLLHNWGESEDIFLTHVEEGHGEIGKPKERNVSSTVITNFFKYNLRFTRARRIERILQKPRNLVVFDYSVMPHKYYYSQGLKQNYYMFINIAHAYVETINMVGPAREQFITINMPDMLPERSDLMKVAEEEPAQVELNLFTDVGSFWLRELWLLTKGLGVLSKVKHPEHLNVLLVDGTGVISFNVGMLIERSENESNGQRAVVELLSKVAETRTAIETEELPSLDDKEENNGVARAAVTNNTPELLIGIKENVRSGTMTPKEAERLVKLAEASYELPNPLGEGTIKEVVEVTKEEVQINEELRSTGNKLIVSDEMRKSRTTNLNKDYIEKSLEKDVLRSIMGLSSAGAVVKNIERTEAMDAGNDYIDFKFTLILANGKQSTPRFRIPKVRPDGTFKANGVEYTMAQSKVDMPIRKVSPTRVALTSYYGKVFIDRSQKAVNDRSTWVAKKIVNMSLDTTDTRVTKGNLGTNDVPLDVKLPRDYVALTTRVTSFTVGSLNFMFAYSKIATTFDEATVKLAKSNALTLCGKSPKGSLAMGLDNVVYELIGNSVEPLGPMKTVVGGKWGKEPLDVFNMDVFGRLVPLGIVLGRYTGLKEVLKRTKIKYREVPSNTRVTLNDDEFKITFKDTTLIVERYHPVASPLLAGYSLANDEMSKYNMAEFESPNVYTAIFFSHGLHPMAVRELKLIREAFVDPKTKEILVEMKEPTLLLDLLYRAAHLLRDDRSPKETDPKFMKLRGYERIAGFMYKEFVDSLRMQRSLPNPATGSVSIRPMAVWQIMVGDATTQLVQVVNPVHALKEQEAVSLSGQGGRSSLSLVGKTRVFHKDDVGIFSESVPDSGKVGVRSNLTANAAINSTLGTFGKFDKKSGAVGAFSTTSNMLPASNHDDGKRANFSSVQQSAVSPAHGYTTMPYLTGYESVMASRLGKSFVFNAQQAGKVVKVTSESIGVEYEDGTKDGTKLGTWHGDMAGKSISHTYITDLKEGDTFTPGSVLAWNKTFFERDLFSNTNVVNKTSALATVALLESNDTLEDGCAVDASIGEKLTTIITKKRAIAVSFDHDLFEVKKIGDKVNFDDALFTMTDSKVSGTISQTELKALARLAKFSPKAKQSGTVANLEIMYQGELEDMTESLRDLCVTENKRRKNLVKNTGARESETAQVKDTIYFGGEEVAPNTVVIKYSIDDDSVLGTGDKLVVANQLKSIVGRKMVGSNKTEDGRDVNLIFGWRSINDRIVLSPLKMGVLATMSKHVMKSVVAAYKK